MVDDEVFLALQQSHTELQRHMMTLQDQVISLQLVVSRLFDRMDRHVATETHVHGYPKFDYRQSPTAILRDHLGPMPQLNAASGNA